MALPARDDTDLPWPESWVIELIGDHYAASPLSAATKLSLARRHAGALHDLLAGREPSWRATRRDLVALCAGVGIDADRIATIDCAVFFEITRLAAERFRTSPRGREGAARVLSAAVGRLKAFGPQRGAPERLAA